MIDIKDRVEKLDERIKLLVKKYPLVAAVIVLASFTLGFLVGAWAF